MGIWALGGGEPSLATAHTSKWENGHTGSQTKPDHRLGGQGK